MISCDKIINYAKTNALYKHRHYQSLVLVYKALNNFGPSYMYIRDFFKLMTVEYNLRAIGTKLVLPYFNLEWVYTNPSLISLPTCGTLYL